MSDKNTWNYDISHYLSFMLQLLLVTFIFLLLVFTLYYFHVPLPSYYSPLSAVGDVGLTVDACEARLAGASVTVHIIGASSTVPAGGALALVDLHGTARPGEAG